jgi:thiamine-phosphate pyrophosphorylase
MICLVTDRRRLAAGPAVERACLVAQVRRGVDAGVDLIQVRERDLEAGALAGLVEELVSVTAGTPTRLIVNDRMDVALAAGADGVHLRGDSIPIREARRLAPEGFLIGRSVHAASEAAAAAAADYLIAGTVFPSASKPESRPLLGIEGLRAIVRAARPPVLAIGGMAGTRIGEASAAGAAGIAAIGLFVGSQPDPEADGCRVADLRQTVKTARSWFDRLNITP